MQLARLKTCINHAVSVALLPSSILDQYGMSRLPVVILLLNDFGVVLPVLN